MLETAGALIGGLGLFLLAIGMMTDGLKLAAGSALRDLLSSWSRTPLRGLLAGSIMTAIVQSSSAVTVATLGFVNAGLISMRQTLGIIYGANVGTTMTGWLVALVGFKFSIQAFALPLIGIGMMLKLIQGKGRWASVGLAMVGFGLFFIGLDVLKGAFEGIVGRFDLSQFTAEGVSGVLIYLMLGVIMTILTQSSSASIALTITAASSDMIGLYAAGAMVIGANIGTTSTALLASLGATLNARRVALAQVIFNVGTALVALLLLPVLFRLIQHVSDWFGLSTEPAVALALFHTSFNLLGVLLIFPLNDRLADFLETRFRSQREDAARPRFLDKTVAATPVLAVNALLLENRALADRLIRCFGQAVRLHKADIRGCQEELVALKALTGEVSRFIITIEQSALDKETTGHLASMLALEQNLFNGIVSLERLSEYLSARESMPATLSDQSCQRFLFEIFQVLAAGREDPEGRAATVVDLQPVETAYDVAKSDIILSGLRQHQRVDQLTGTLEALSEARQFARSWHKASTRLTALEQQLKTRDKSHEAASEEMATVKSKTGLVDETGQG